MSLEGLRRGGREHTDPERRGRGHGRLGTQRREAVPHPTPLPVGAWVPLIEVPSSKWARIPSSALETRKTPVPLFSATLGQSTAIFSRLRTMPGLVEPSPGAALGTCFVSPVLPSKNDTKRRSFPAAVADSRHPPRFSADLPRSPRTSVYDFVLHSSGSLACSSTTDDSDVVQEY